MQVVYRYILTLPVCRKKVDALTKFDIKLYQHAVYRFLKDWEEIAEPYHLNVCHFNSRKKALVQALDSKYTYSRWIIAKLKECT